MENDLEAIFAALRYFIFTRIMINFSHQPPPILLAIFMQNH